jgi:spermidine/putrescine transport system substrate-binding protein
MTHPYDGSSIDLERELVRYMAERRVTRRELLQRIAAVGATAALAPVIAACTGSGASISPSAASPTQGSATTAPSAAPTASAEPTPVPSPESQLHIYNYADYLDPTIVSDFEKKYGTKVDITFFDSYDVMFPRVQAGNSGFDMTFPTDTDIPGLVEQGKVLPLDLSLIPNVVNLAAEWADVAYDPGHKHSMPYMWWTTGFAYDTDKIKEDLTSWASLWDPRFNDHIMVLDDQREAFAAALIRQGKNINTVDDAELDAALTLLKEQRPLVRKYSGDPIGDFKSKGIWVGHDWSGDVWTIQETRPSVKYVLPDEGGVRGSDAAVILQGAQHPVAANLFINHLLDAKVSAANTNAIYYMGPNAAAKEFILPELLADPSVNPDQAIIDKLQELIDPGADLEKYSKRWTELRAGA